MDAFSRASLCFIQPTSKTRHLAQFRTLFGTSPTVCHIIWTMIDAELSLPVNAQKVHLLLSLLFLRNYETEEMNSIISNFTEKTFRKWTKIYVPLIASVQVVRTQNIFKNLLVLYLD